MIATPRKLSLSLLSSLLLVCGGCTGEETGEKAGGGQANNAGKPEGSGGEPMHDDDHGDAHPLGKLTAHGVTFDVTQFGHIEAGEEGAIELTFANGDDRISTVRGWVGVESGEGSMKSMWQLEGDAGIHGHVDVPDPIPEGSKIWIELEKAGKTETVSVAYHQ